MREKEYEKLVESMAPKSPMGKDCAKAFVVGGLICVAGQLLMNFYGKLGLDPELAGTAASMTLATTLTTRHKNAITISIKISGGTFENLATGSNKSKGNGLIDVCQDNNSVYNGNFALSVPF